MQKKPLYILTYDHGGYVLWGDSVKPRLKELINWMEKYPKLKIGLDYEAFTFDEYSKTDPEIIELIKFFLEKYPKRVGLGSTTYGQPLSLTISEESNVRQLTYAIKANIKHFGTTPNVYSISEFALNNQTPQLIKLCGYDAAILRSHVMGYGYTKNFDLPWGKWIGKDLTEIPAVPTYEKQGRGFNCTTLDNWILSRWPREEAHYSLDDFEEIFEHISPLLASRYDDLTQDIKDVTEYIETKENYHYVLLEDLPELYGEATAEMKTNDNDFHVQMPWGYCGNEIFNGCRKAEVAAVQSGGLNALAVMLGGKSLQTEIENAWKNVLVAQHHDVTICGLLDLSRRFIPDSLKASSEVTEKSASHLKKLFADKNNNSLLIANLNSFDIDEWLEIDVNDNVCAFDGEEMLECELINEGKTLCFHIKCKALSVKKITLRSVKNNIGSFEYKWNEESGVLETPLYNAKLTADGIAYIEYKTNNKRIFDNGSGELFTAYIDGRSRASSGKWDVTVNSCGCIAKQIGKIGTVSFEFEMRFYGKNPRIDCKAKFDIQGEHIGHAGVCEGLKKSITVDGERHEEKLNFVMNLCLDKNRRMTRDLPFSISDWNGAVRDNEEYWYPDDLIRYEKEVSPEESFKGVTYMQGIYWLCMRDKKHGLAVFNRGCMGSVIEGNRLSIPLIYSDLYMCGTRILNSSFENEFALFPFCDELPDCDIHKNAVSYVYQPMVIPMDRGCGTLSEFNIADLEMHGGEIILTSIYPEDGFIFARFCNYSDESANLNFKLSKGNVICETDLLGNETLETDGKLNFRPWEIKTVKTSI